MSSKPAERLRDAVKTRRQELGLNQLEVGELGGPSNTKLTEIEGGRTEKLTNNMARKLDRGLKWKPGGARRVWDGLGAAEPVEADDLIDQILEDPRLSAEAKLEMIRSARRDVRHEGRRTG